MRIDEIMAHIKVKPFDHLSRRDINWLISEHTRLTAELARKDKAIDKAIDLCASSHGSKSEIQELLEKAQ